MFVRRYRRLKLLLLAGVLSSSSCGATDVPVFDADLISEFSAPNARQGVAVDDRYVYAVTNYAISRHDKNTGEIDASWTGRGEGDPLTHMDSLVALDGRLYASHSNYPEWPMTSSVEIWDADTLTHVDTHSFGVQRGSFTWLDRHEGHWWGAFANYDKVQTGQSEPYGMTERTQVVKFDDRFVVIESWTLPKEILDRMRPMSNSGGSWGADGYLYLTGHDHGEIYVMELPEAGSVLHWAATVRVPIMEGQGIAWDRSEDQAILWAIYKRERKILKIRMPKITHARPQGAE